MRAPNLDQLRASMSGDARIQRDDQAASESEGGAESDASAEVSVELTNPLPAWALQHADRPGTTYVGIDPGTDTGVATWHEPDEDLIVWPARPFWDAYCGIVCHFSTEDTIIMLEDPNAHRPIFERGVGGRKLLKIAQNVGMNKRDAKLWARGLRRSGYNVVLNPPTESKWSEELFKRITGYDGQTSQHGRDAARLVYDI